jgi:hypothetical protein
MDAKWDRQDLKPNEADYGKAPALFQYSPTEILIFKGDGKQDAYLFKPGEKSLKKTNDYITSEYGFINCQYHINGSIWTFGYRAHAHRYDPLEKDVSKRYTAYPFEKIKK